MPLTRGVGTVMYINQEFYTIRHNGMAVMVPRKLLKRELQQDDIVAFEAVDLTEAEKTAFNNSSNSKIMWRATKVSFQKSTRIIRGTGEFMNLTKEYGFIRYKHEDAFITIYCTRVTISPAVNSLLDMFKTGSPVNFVAKEQPPNKSDVVWRAHCATIPKYQIIEINNEGSIRYKTILASEVFENKIQPVLPAPKTAAQMAMEEDAKPLRIRQVKPAHTVTLTQDKEFVKVKREPSPPSPPSFRQESRVRLPSPPRRSPAPGASFQNYARSISPPGFPSRLTPTPTPTPKVDETSLEYYEEQSRLFSQLAHFFLDGRVCPCGNYDNNNQTQSLI